MSLFAAAVMATCRSRQLLSRGDRVLVAHSGGADSTALLAALDELRKIGELSYLASIHVDHGLRADSEKDGLFCEELCGRLQIPFERVSVKVAPGNVQAQARRARYVVLKNAAARYQANRVATGHTLTDQAETVLLRLLRGSGARGLSGIPPRRGLFIRPLIDRERTEVVAYLRSRGLIWREDPSNATSRFLRNRLRHELIPLLRTVNPSVENALARTADLLRDDEKALNYQGRVLVSDSAAVDLARFLLEPVAVRRRVVRALWQRAHGRSTGLLARHVEAVLSICWKNRPGSVTLPGGFEAFCRYGRLTIGPSSSAGHPEASELSLPGPGVYPLPGKTVRLEIQPCPGAKLGEVHWPLILRTRRPGDRFRPKGGPGSKKLKSWLIDRKVPREERDKLLVVADANGEVLFLPDLGLTSANRLLEFSLV